MIVKLLTEHHLEFHSLKGGCRGSSESSHVKMSCCWNSHAATDIIISIYHLGWPQIFSTYATENGLKFEHLSLSVVK